MKIGPAEVWPTTAEIKLVDDKFTRQLEVFSRVGLDFESKQLKKKVLRWEARFASDVAELAPWSILGEAFLVGRGVITNWLLRKWQDPCISLAGSSGSL